MLGDYQRLQPFGFFSRTIDEERVFFLLLLLLVGTDALRDDTPSFDVLSAVVFVLSPLSSSPLLLLSSLDDAGVADVSDVFFAYTTVRVNLNFLQNKQR
jgi:hypothetical protein